jgi:hypothetical protein
MITECKFNCKAFTWTPLKGLKTDAIPDKLPDFFAKLKVGNNTLDLPILHHLAAKGWLY